MTELLRVERAEYGSDDVTINVQARIERLIENNCLDFTVSNDVCAGYDPVPGVRKSLMLEYRVGDNETVTLVKKEREEVVIGPKDKNIRGVRPVTQPALELNDHLVRKFKLNDRRLRGPMPVELQQFDRTDLARFMAELKFTKGAEIGVAEGHYSETLCQWIPDLELICVDPWTRYSDNPRAHSEEHQQFSENETRRRLAPYPKTKIVKDYSMNAVNDVPWESLDFCYIDGHHSFDYVMQDLIEWSRRVRSGGIVAGDDYFPMRWGGVVEAVNAYTEAHDIPLWFIMQVPRGVDFFWVKP
jgi:hypothetical protein